MAGGEGSRLRPMTVNRPKPLVPIGNRPIMDHIVRLLASHGLTEVVATLYYRAEEIQAYFGDGSDFGVSMIHSIENEPLGTAGSVKLAQEHLDTTFVIISGDALTDLDIGKALDFHREKGAQATLVLSRVPNPLEFGIVITQDDGRIERFLEKPGWSEVFSDTVNTGIYILEPEVLDRIPAGENRDWSKDVFPAMLAEGAPIYGYIMPEYWSDVGTISQYMDAQTHLLQRDAKLEIPGEEVRPGIWIGEGTVIDEDAILEAPVVVGGQCRIRAGARLGPCTVVGDGCIVESGAQLDGAVIWDGSYIGPEAHVEHAIVGSRCTIKKGSQIRDEAVIGDRTLIDVDAIVRPQIKVFPDKTVERGATVTMSIVSGSHGRGTLFRDLGVAGLSNIEITPEFAIRFGLAFGSAMPGGSQIVTGRDSTRSSRMIKRALIASLLSTGCGVIDMRSAPVPVARHHVRATSAAGALFVRKLPGNARLTLMEAFDAGGGYINQALQRKIESSFFREEFKRTDAEELGVIDIASHAVEMYTQSFFRTLGETRDGRRPRIVIDYGFSSISPMYPAILARLGVESITLNGVNDAKAAPRTSDQIGEHLSKLSHIVGSLGYDLGVLVTNEGERLTVVDDLGIPVTGTSLYAAMALLVAKAQPEAKIGMSVAGSEKLERHLAANGARMVRSKASARDLMAAAATEQMAFAGDEEGGFIFPELTSGFDAMFSLARLLRMLGDQKVKLSDMVTALPELHTASAVAPCRWDGKGLVMRRMAELGRESRADLRDGIKIYDQGGWVLVLPDSFEPVFHLFAEAESDPGASKLIEQYRRRIEEWGAEA
jgi:mannose-1-phosphate guanylyltransferase/phosphomannomutase